MSADLLAVLRRIANSSAPSYDKINEIYEKTQPESVAPQPPIPVNSLNSFISSPATQTNSSTDWGDLYQELAAIREHDGGYSRVEAERLSWGELEIRWHGAHGERVARDLCAGCRRPTQLTLPGVPPATADRPRRRCAWRFELRRTIELLADQRARDAQRNAETLRRLAEQLEDVRHRLADLERGVGIADPRRPSHHRARGW